MAPHKRDKTHSELIKAMKNRMGGYWRDENGGHHAHLLGLTVDAFDLYKVGSGVPDWLVFVGWLAVFIEIKNPERVLSKKSTPQKQIIIQGRFTPDEREFMRNFHGIRRTLYEQNEIYDFLLSVARLVGDADDILAGRLPKSYMQIFFPKVDLTGIMPVEGEEGDSL